MTQADPRQHHKPRPQLSLWPRTGSLHSIPIIIKRLRAGGFNTQVETKYTCCASVTLSLNIKCAHGKKCCDIYFARPSHYHRNNPVTHVKRVQHYGHVSHNRITPADNRITWPWLNYAPSSLIANLWVWRRLDYGPVTETKH